MSVINGLIDQVIARHPHPIRAAHNPECLVQKVMVIEDVICDR